MIKLANVSYVYGEGTENEALALDKINLEVADGEFVAILGRNGSGKSTLARHLNGLLLPAQGEVEVDGLKTSNPEDLWKIRQKVGMIFQNPDNQIVATIVEEDVAFAPENLGLPPEEIKRRVDEALRMVHLNKYARYEPHLLSGGQKQRLAIAGALAMKPKVLVLDEPTAMLDPVGRKEVLEAALSLNKKQGTTVVYITHFAEEAAVADRVALMDGGRIAALGSPREIFADPAKVKKLGVDIPPVVELAGRLVKAGVKIDFPPLTVEEMVTRLCSLS